MPRNPLLPGAAELQKRTCKGVTLMGRPLRPKLDHANCISPRRLILISVLWILGISVSQLGATTVRQVGIDSNFLIVGDRIFFAQADDSLTVLDLRNGAVLARLVDGDYSGTLRQTDEGILVWAYRRITLIDLDTLVPRWSVLKPHGVYNVNILNRQLLASDGDGMIECRDLASGEVQWTYNLPGAVDIVAQSNHVLIHQKYTKYPTTVVLLEVATGQELYRKEPPANVLYLRAYFDGEQVYVACGTVSDDELEESESFGPDATCDRFLVWDIAGRETMNFEAPPSVRGKDIELDYEEFTIVGKRFTRSGLVLSEGSEYSVMGPIVKQHTLETANLKLPDGSVQIREYLEDRDGKYGTVVEYLSVLGEWQGYLPYLGVHGRISQAAVANDSLLLGSNVGHVECIDVVTGSSRWMYVFAAIERIMSYSSPGGLPPYYADQAKEFRRANQDKRNVTGMIVLPTTMSLDTVRWADVATSVEKRHLTVIVDPSPQDPFNELPDLLRVAWAGATAPILLLALVVTAFRMVKRKLQRGAVAGLWLTVLVIGGVNLFFFGRVAFSSTMATKLVLLCSTCFLLFHIARLFKENQLVIASVYLGLLLASAYLLYLPMIYA